MKHRERIARFLMIQAHASGDDWKEAADEADALLQHLEANGLVLMPAEPAPRFRHEAAKAGGITAGSFAAMWNHCVAYARTLER